MGYRKLRKAYLRKFGCTVNVKLRDRSGHLLRKASKIATANFMKSCLAKA